MSRDLKYTTIVPASTPLGESTFAAARREIETRYGVSPDEVFLDGIQVEGRIQAGDVEIDLDTLHLRIITFGADRPAPAPVEVAETVPGALSDLVTENAVPSSADTAWLDSTTTS